MPRQVLTIAFVLAVAIITLPACSLLPNEPWMGARPEWYCEANELELVQYLRKECPPEYIPQYCEGLAVMTICMEDE